jgi:hypothetical protein
MDADDVTDYAPYKDDRWSKTMSRRKRPQHGEYCTFCRHHHCGDPTQVFGTRSLKKSKVVTYKHTKFYETSDLNPYFRDLRNGLWSLQEEE